MSDHPESSLGELVDLPGERWCDEVELRFVGTWTRPVTCDGQLQVFERTRPPRQVICSRCGHVSYEVPLNEEEAA